MARRARFGQTPRVQMSLTSTLVSIAREMVNREDSNIMSAWKNGGEFEGKKVTDQAVLAYWKQREDGLDHSDPTFDSMQNQIQQLQYGIAQSEMDLKHLQGKVSDGAFASFYLKWAKKAPRNSEWWRSLQKDAAQLLESAKAKARANSQNSKTEAFNKFVGDTTKSDISIGNELAQALQDKAKETGMSLTDDGAALLSLVTSEYNSNPDKYRALHDAVKAGDPTFGGAFTPRYFAQAMDNAANGYKDIATRANADGFASQYANAAKGQADMHWFAQNSNAWPVAKTYDRAYQLWQSQTGPGSSWEDRKTANEAFAAAVRGLAGTKGLDQAAVVMLNNDAARAVGDAAAGDSFGATMLGQTGVTPDMQAGAAQVRDASDLKAQNPGAFVYAPVDKNGAFDLTGAGAVGIVPAQSVPKDAVMVAVPGLDGTMHMTAIKPNSVYVKDPNQPDKDGTQVGSVLSYQIGGKTTTLYGYFDGQGNQQWSSSSPFNPGLSVQPDAKGNITLSSGAAATPQADRLAQAAALDAKYGTHIADDMKANGLTGAQSFGADKTDTTSNKVTITFDPEKGFTVKKAATYQVPGPNGSVTAEGDSVTTNPYPAPVASLTDAYTAAMDPGRVQAGSINGVTSNTPLTASMNAAKNAMSPSDVRAYMKDPDFQHAFWLQENAALGVADSTQDLRSTEEFSKLDQTLNVPDFQLAQPGSVLPNGKRVPIVAQDRADLTYPGATQRGDGRADVPGITFGGQTIKVPAAPLMGANTPGIPQAAAAGTPAFSSQVLQPGQVPGQPLAAKPVTPATTFTTTPTAPPTAVAPAPTPTPAPTPVSTAPSPTAPGGPGGAHRPGGGQ